jgi:hypothetical protein
MESMRMSYVGSLFVLPFLLMTFALTVGLQIFLSLVPSRWPGLILPGIGVLTAMFLAFGATIYTGEILSVLMAFVMYLIPTLIYFAIYLACRSKIHGRQQHERDGVDDHALS